MVAVLKFFRHLWTGDGKQIIHQKVRKMKKSFKLTCLALLVLNIIGLWSAMSFDSSNKIFMQNRELKKENFLLENENKNLREILDSIDNPHHHDYLTTLRAYNALEK